MKFRFTLQNLETGENIQYRTLKELATKNNIEYHQARSILLSEEKLFIHPNIKLLCDKYKIIKNI